jgi:hypothetical protein
MPVDHHRLLLLAKLATLPIAEDGWLWPVRPGRVWLDAPDDRARAEGQLHLLGVAEAWGRLVAAERPPGLRQELATALFDLVWRTEPDARAGEPIELAAHYRRLAQMFLRPAGDRIALDPRPDTLALGLTRLEALLLAHLVRLRVGPDLLPALLVAGLPSTERRALLAGGLVVDDAAPRPLADLLDQGEPPGAGLADCHVHAGSALRAEFVWPHMLRRLECDTRLFLAQPGQLHGLALDSHLFVIGAVVRRVLALLVMGRWPALLRRIEDIWRRLERDAPLTLRGFLDQRPEYEWVGELRWFRGLWVSEGLAEPAEPWLLVESRAMLDADPGLPSGFDALWWFYVRVRARFHRHFIEEPGLEGLGYFNEIYQRSKALGALRQRVQQYPAELMRHLNPLGRMRHIEMRVVPDPSALAELLSVAAEMARQRRARDGRGATLSVVAHSVKWGSLAESGGLDLAMLALRDEITNLETLMEIEAPIGLPRHVVGFDVAGRELARPNWFYLPAFVELRDWWRSHLAPHCPGCHAFGYTFHAGEDYLHLIQGLRHIGEVLSWFPWEAGDRIGHGLALATDALAWQARTPLVAARPDWVLFDLTWEWGLAVEQGLPMEPGFLARLGDMIVRLGEDLLDADAAASADGGVGRSGWADAGAEATASRPRTAREWHDVFRALFCPNLVLGVRDAPVWWRGISDYRSHECGPLFTRPHVRWALPRYLRLLDRGVPLAPISYPFRATAADRALEAERIRNLQEHLIAALARAHVAVEACPLSNQTITGIPTLVDHPLLALRGRLPVIANTDNPLTFGTDLPLELRLLFEAALERDDDAERALAAVRALVADGQRFRFGRAG